MFHPKRIITFSRNVFIPVTNMCHNSCAYCGFKRSPDHPDSYILSPEDVEDILLAGAGSGCTEALFTFGEKPETETGYLNRLRQIGYDSTIEYLADLCRMAINIGLLPHCNPGILTYEELEILKPLNASMGLMLETTAALDAHNGSPGKMPQVRIRTIEDAGLLKIPFTTGLLIGIGETREDRIDSLNVINSLHHKYGHIQEVIIQNFTPKPGTKMADHSPPQIEDLIWTVDQAKNILSSDIAIQVPPNLVSPEILINHGATDLGGISPETIDHINPDHEWPSVAELKRMVGKRFELKERLPIYLLHIKKGWFSEEIRSLIQQFAGDDGYRKSK
ncbi:MAG: 7,8-didemethyl-8-hydroxy-5-deazariboflavin synthase subunit CofG [Methanosarcinales archaeon]|nr:7,8-didemethyl-8-hydroxy-5-deazariboflavin synthase subunit CofG [Methanosarcinales archaeon]